MLSAKLTSFGTITLAAAISASASLAQNAANPDVIFDNAIDPAATEQFVDNMLAPTASEAMFTGWQVSYQMYLDAEETGAPAAQLDALRAAADAAGAAYEAALIAQNTLQMASAGPELLSDETIALLFPTEEFAATE